MKTKKLLIGLLVGALLFNSSDMIARATETTETENTVASTVIDATETQILKATNTETTVNSTDATQTISDETVTSLQEASKEVNIIDEAKLAEEKAAKAKEAKEKAAKAAKLAAAKKAAEKKAADLKKRQTAEYKKQVKYLAALIYTEAGNQSYKGKVAVANVVLNRAGSKNLTADKIHDVIYAPNQFSVVRNGSFVRAVSNFSDFDAANEKECIQAAKAVLNGKNYVGNRKYFTRYSKTLASQHKSGVKIGDHYFW